MDSLIMETSMKREMAKRGFGGRLKPLFDSLESRLALSGTTLGAGLSGLVTSLVAPPTSGSSLTIVSVSPSQSSILTSSPMAILVTFDRPIDPITLGAGSLDFQLVHVASDGSTMPLSNREAQFDEALDASDPTGSRISLTLSRPLAAGNYRLLLSPGSVLQGVDGSYLAGNNGAATDLTDFSVEPAETGLTGALDLGTIGSTELVQSDVLNLAADPGAVKYYKLALAPGHQWRLGLEISTLSDGSQLTSALSLFDSSGHLISSDNVGLPDRPGDPYLFAGLAPGTYYVGVSARINLPDSSGVYDPSQTAIDNAGVPDPGGPFQLHVVADLADQPTQVLGLRLDHADPLSTDPSGLTLEFSSSIQIGSLVNASEPAVTLVDQHGQVWSLTPTQYLGSLGQLSFLFDQPLPEGTYTLEIGGTRELVDLAGRPPVGLGLYPAVLGTFSVLPPSNPTGDLGPLLPGVAQNGLTSSYSIDATSSVSKQFVVVEPGFYVISGVKPLIGVTYTLVDTTGLAISLSPGASKIGNGDVDQFLSSGLYSLILTNSGTHPVEVPVTILEKQVLFSQLLESGVAQGSAFNLRLVSAQANFAAEPNGVGSPLNPTPTAIDPQAGAGSQSASTGQGQVVSSSGTPGNGLLGPIVLSTSGILLGISPVGYPSSQSNQISVVGPSGPSGSVALASNSPGIPSGLLLVPSLDSPGEGPQTEIVATDPAESLNRGSTIDAGTLAQSAESRRVDEQTLAEADWVGRLVSYVIGVVGQPRVGGAAKVADTVESIAVVSTEGVDKSMDEARIESASLSSPIAVGVILTTIGYRLRRNLASRFFFGSTTAPKRSIKDQPVLTGPHRRVRSKVNSRNN
jgi:hypothetical protein